MRVLKWLVGIVAVIAVIVGVAAWIDSTLPNSTPGVTVVGGNTARVAKGEDFVLTYTVFCGKGCVTENVWHITFDGVATVNFDEDGFLFFDGDHRSGTVCGVGCTSKVEMGFLLDDMYITGRADGAVDVKWPGGWNFRPYEP